MNQLKNVVILFLLFGFSFPSVAAVSGFDLPACSVLAEEEKDDKKGEGEEEEEEEPDCE